MAEVSRLFGSSEVRRATEEEARLAAAVAEAVGCEAYPRSAAVAPGGAVLMARRGIGKRLFVAVDEKRVPDWLHGFSGDATRARVGGVAVSLSFGESGLSLQQFAFQLRL